MSAPDQPENRREAARWLPIIAEDIDVATAAVRLSHLGSSAYHCQQATEKLIKALLIPAALTNDSPPPLAGGGWGEGAVPISLEIPCRITPSPCPLPQGEGEAYGSMVRAAGITLAGEPFRRTHDLDELVAKLLPVYPQFATQAEAVRHLSIWAIAYRYPGPEDESEPLPEPVELDRLIHLLIDFAASVSQLIGPS